MRIKLKQKYPFKILIACEESQNVCVSFRKLGFEAYSNDIIDCSGDYPQFHLKMDVFDAIKLESWDLMIAHPPCTHLSVSGMCWFQEGNKTKKYNGPKPLYLQTEALEFVWKLMNVNIPHIAIENPISIISTRIKEPTQYIQPYKFGHPETKKTCLWLKNLPELKETNDVYDYMMTLPIKERNRIHWLGGNKSKERSVTYKGIADAMADQWGKFLIKWNKSKLI